MSETIALQNELFADVGRRSSDLGPSPKYGEGAGVLRPYVDAAIGNLRKYYQKVVGQRPDFGDARISMKKLPITRRGIMHGAYDPATGRVYVNKDSVEAGPDTPIRKKLRKKGLTENPQDVVAHELTHHTQKKTGAIQRYSNRLGKLARYVIEGAASIITGEITGRPQDSYPREQSTVSRLMKRYGIKDMVTGTAPVRVRRAFVPAYRTA